MDGDHLAGREPSAGEVAQGHGKPTGPAVELVERAGAPELLMERHTRGRRGDEEVPGSDDPAQSAGRVHDEHAVGVAVQHGDHRLGRGRAQRYARSTVVRQGGGSDRGPPGGQPGPDVGIGEDGETLTGDRHRRVAGVARRHRGRDLHDAQMGVDDQGRPFDEVVDQRVRRVGWLTHPR